MLLHRDLLRVIRVNSYQGVKYLHQILHVNCSYTFCYSVIYLQIFVDSPYVLSGIEQQWILLGGNNYSLKFFLYILKHTGNIINLNVRILLYAYHPAKAFINIKNLMQLQIIKNFRQLLNQMIQKDFGVFINWMQFYELVLCQFRDFQESFGGHVLHSRMLFTHELIKFINYCLKEWPMSD